jgi:hypothetical protein
MFGVANASTVPTVAGPLAVDTMTRTEFDADDVGKTVVTVDGRRVGAISAVERGRAYVDPGPGGKTTATSVLAWQDIDDEHGYPLKGGVVETVSGDEVRVAPPG